jgi:DNA repair exonuclease SbcCD ATPase subunit
MRLVAAAGLASLLFVLGACGGPEDDVAEYFEDMTAILEDHMDDPVRGVEELRKYVREILPEVLSILGHVAVELDEIEDAEERKKRIDEMLETLQEPLDEFHKVFWKFLAKARADEKAWKTLLDFRQSWKSTVETFAEFGGALGLL